MTVERNYYQNGQLHYEWPYKEGKQHGVTKGWHSSGKLHYKHPYQEGVLHGITEAWYENGKSKYKHYYLYGDVVTKEEFRKHQLIEKLSGL